ncbi:hypothetical protein JOC54_001610 [Alkalihalobacillus xiaoxiensis]|uniref:Uncharacterized protein n=1 Tax=Shouchella xiaoxiensis TaxID=766895 RepID=A0ABS2SS49_9BACI|nr:hypothetical protein [Shouchella xiaoxiensis]MBM7838354.1 hypothetical protein [Shouchella xiaoxiensis]
MEKQVFMLSSHDEQGRTYDENRIYSFSNEEADQLVTSGKAANIDFPYLSAYKSDAEQAVKRYKAKRDEIKTSERYDSNESERQYQLKSVRQELDDYISAKKEEYAVELEANYRIEAGKAFSVDVSPDAQSFVDSVKAQFASGINSDDLSHILIARLKSASDEEKHAFALSYPSIKTYIPKEYQPYLEPFAKYANSAGKAILNCKILRELPTSFSPFRAYETMKTVENYGK